MDLDALVNLAVSDAQVIYGERVALLSHARGLPSRQSGSRNRGRPWMPEEDEFYRANAGKLSYSEIAKHLGRSPAAIKVHFTRAGLPAASKTADFLTAQKVSELLSIDPHKTVRWIDEGILPGERMFFTGRVIRRTRIMALKIWLTRPEHWIYFDATLIKNLSLRRLVLRAQQRWGDEWWTTRQAADALGVDSWDIEHQIKLGRIGGIQAVHLGGRDLARWSFWYVRKSEAIRLVIPRGKGRAKTRTHWSPGGDAFILEQRAAGKTYGEIARRMKWKQKRVEFRARCLRANSEEK